MNGVVGTPELWFDAATRWELTLDGSDQASQCMNRFV